MHYFFFLTVQTSTPAMSIKDLEQILGFVELKVPVTLSRPDRSAAERVEESPLTVEAVQETMIKCVFVD